jgi:chitin disaccharide deacetylase
MKKLIVNADDFGLCRGTVSGVYTAWRHGIVTSASLIVTAPASNLAMQTARRHPKLDIGIHLSFTEGTPVLPAAQVPSLVDESGQFPSARHWREARRRPNATQLADEFTAQIERARQTGVTLSHLDLHSYLGYFMPDVFALAVDLAAHHGLAMRFPFHEGWEDTAPGVLAAWGIPLAQAETIAGSYRDLLAGKAVCPDYFVEPFAEGVVGAGGLMSAIAQARPGVSELVTHPAKLPGCTAYLGPEAKQRAAELDLLCDRRMRRMLEIAKVELTDFRHLEIELESASTRPESSQA